MVGGDKICSNGDIDSSTKDLADKCLDMYGEILLRHKRSISNFSNNIVRYLLIHNGSRMIYYEWNADNMVWDEYENTFGKTLAIQ